MATLRESDIRLWQTIRRRRTDADLEEELRSHLAIAADAMQQNGDARESALRTSRIEAGGVVQTLEALRDQRGLPWLETLVRDSRHALRALRRSPTFTVAALPASVSCAMACRLTNPAFAPVGNGAGFTAAAAGAG